MNKENLISQFDGNKAIIIDKEHPHFDCMAICKGVEHTSVGYAMRFSRDGTKEEFFIYHGRQIRWID